MIYFMYKRLKMKQCRRNNENSLSREWEWGNGMLVDTMGRSPILISPHINRIMYGTPVASFAAAALQSLLQREQRNLFLGPVFNHLPEKTVESDFGIIRDSGKSWNHGTYGQMIVMKFGFGVAISCHLVCFFYFRPYIIETAISSRLTAFRCLGLLVEGTRTGATSASEMLMDMTNKSPWLHLRRSKHATDSMVISLGGSLLKAPYCFTQWELTFGQMHLYVYTSSSAQGGGGSLE